MITEQFGEYTLTGLPGRKGSQRYSVGVIIEKNKDGLKNKQIFQAEDGICYILAIEAAKEGINLGKNLIKQNRVGF
ncbi:MAG: hypothetical protein JEY99_11445 [Spirochaetales bacterium]|nr:hypothetical protein [Spirochaetales bacterium]